MQRRLRAPFGDRLGRIAKLAENGQRDFLIHRIVFGQQDAGSGFAPGAVQRLAGRGGARLSTAGTGRRGAPRAGAIATKGLETHPANGGGAAAGIAEAASSISVWFRSTAVPRRSGRRVPPRRFRACPYRAARSRSDRPDLRRLAERSQRGLRASASAGRHCQDRSSVAANSRIRSVIVDHRTLAPRVRPAGERSRQPRGLLLEAAVNQKVEPRPSALSKPISAAHHAARAA